MMDDNNNNFVIVADYIINIVVMHVDVTRMMFFVDYAIVPYKISKDNLDQLVSMMLKLKMMLVLVHY